MCGIFGIYGHHEAASLAYLGLAGLQHRGQESAGTTAALGYAAEAQIPFEIGLIANNKTEEEIRGFVDCDSLGYLSLAGTLRSVDERPPERTYCDACFSGQYPVPCEEPVKVKPLPLLQR